MAAGLQKVRFYHYLLVILWPPLGSFFTGKPVTGAISSVILAIAVPLTFGVLLIGWFGFVPYQLRALRAWERGYQFLD